MSLSDGPRCPRCDEPGRVVLDVPCPACGSPCVPLAANTARFVLWVPVKCSGRKCRREFVLRAEVLAVSEQSQAQYLGGVA